MCNEQAGKTMLVTGGSRGIGRGIALVAASKGYDVAITYSTKKDDAEEVAKIIQTQYGRKCVVFQASMEQEGVPVRTVEAAIQALGRLDVLVNNAGLTILDSILDMPMEKLDLLINLNFKGYVLAAQAAARHMVEKGIKGSIINITSTRGYRAYPGDAIYGGLKSAIVRATESFALDLAPYGIRINCVAPGAIQVRFDERTQKFYDKLSARIPLERAGTPEDIGYAVVWLASEEASYITGTTLKVDGGLILPGMPEGPNYTEGWGAKK